MKNFIKEYWGLILFAVGVLIFIVCMSFSGLSSEETKQWYSKPLSKFTAGDILILVLVHAWISKSDNNCNCKDKGK